MPGMAGMLGHIRSGKLRALAVTGARRAPQLPDVPTVAESGVPGYEAYVWLGLLAPKATPATVIDRVYREVLAVLATDDGVLSLGAGEERWVTISQMTATAAQVAQVEFQIRIARLPAPAATDPAPVITSLQSNLKNPVSSPAARRDRCAMTATPRQDKWV